MKYTEIIFFLLGIACGTLSLPVGAVGSSTSNRPKRLTLAYQPQKEEEEDQELLETIKNNGLLDVTHVVPLFELVQRGGDVAVDAAGVLSTLASRGLLDATHVERLFELVQRGGDVGISAARALRYLASSGLLGATHVERLFELAQRDDDVAVHAAAALSTLASSGLLDATHVATLFELVQRDGDVGKAISSVIANYFQHSQDTDEVRGCMNSHFSSLVEGAKKGNIFFARSISFLASRGLVKNSHYTALRGLVDVGGQVGEAAKASIAVATSKGCGFRSFYQKKRYLLPALASLIAAHRIYTHRALLRTKDPERRRAQLAKMWILDRLLMRGASWAHDNVLPQRWRLAQD